ncbi:hypothetical protein, partial [Candidatus Hodgkinia cicadicola]|uniref:hypothetical protein n=1 Tax=Candidatus Hodgkinia cicadicola TaxID=573658 RepID=UPI002414E8E8
MITRYKAKKGTEGTNEEEMEMIEEMIGEMIKEDAPEEQPENPTQPEPEVEVTVGDQPDIPTEGVTMDNMMRIMMEQFGQINGKIDQMKEETNEKIDQNSEEL